MEGNIQDSTVQSWKDRKIDLLSRKILRKIKLIDKQCESNINTVAKELYSSKKIF